jgi:ribosome-binding factor A
MNATEVGERERPKPTSVIFCFMRRPEKMAELIRDEIIQIVGYELEDPRVAGVTVTDVRMSENLRDARIFVTVAGKDEEALAALLALRRAAPYVRRQLGLALDLRHAPEIHFVRDTVEERALRVDQLLSSITHETTAEPADTNSEIQQEERGQA